MAKGDNKSINKQIQAGRQTYQPQLQQYTNSLYPQQQSGWQNYNAAAAQNTADYGNLMSGYANYFQNPGIQYNRSPEMQSAMGGYQGFANTGGFSPQDIQDMRSRAVASVNSNYADAANKIAQQRELQGGYSPNYTAAMAQMARNQGYQRSQALTDVNANLAQMVQQGKLAGLQGLGGLSAEDAQLALSALASNAAARNAALSGASSLYSAQPGLTRTFGDQVQASNDALARSLGLSTGYDTNLIGQQIDTAAKVPSNFGTAMGYFGDVTGGLGNLSKIYKPKIA